jgi:dolichol-phosphate mannosyltransferase
MGYEYLDKGKVKLLKRLVSGEIKKELSVILPTFNEAENLDKFIKKLEDNLRGIDYEIIVVDDNSQDGTKKILLDLTKNERVFGLIRKNKRGLFGAIKDGIEIAQGEYIQTMDSDFSHPPKKIKEFWSHRKRFDIISGSRYVRGGHADASFGRKYGSLILNKICSKIMGLEVTDVGGNFHMMKKKDFEKLKISLPSIFGEFSFEWFYNAKKNGFSVKEIPFTYNFRTEGESKMGEDKDFLRLLKIALLYIKRAFVLRVFH